MGQLQEKYGMTLLGKTPPGTCSMCATEHNPEQPHNQQSLAYQYKFYDQHGRWPTWMDAMAHCSGEVKAQWVEALAGYGIIVGEVEKNHHAHLNFFTHQDWQNNTAEGSDGNAQKIAQTAQETPNKGHHPGKRPTGLQNGPHEPGHACCLGGVGAGGGR